MFMHPFNVWVVEIVTTFRNIKRARNYNKLNRWQWVKTRYKKKKKGNRTMNELHRLIRHQMPNNSNKLHIHISQINAFVWNKKKNEEKQSCAVLLIFSWLILPLLLSLFGLFNVRSSDKTQYSDINSWIIALFRWISTFFENRDEVKNIYTETEFISNAINNDKSMHSTNAGTPIKKEWVCVREKERLCKKFIWNSVTNTLAIGQTITIWT